MCFLWLDSISLIQDVTPNQILTRGKWNLYATIAFVVFLGRSVDLRVLFYFSVFPNEKNQQNNIQFRKVD